MKKNKIVRSTLIGETPEDSKRRKRLYTREYRKRPHVIEARKREVAKYYQYRKDKWKEYKKFYIQLRQEKGGKCSLCGYHKNIRILQFHHLRDKLDEVCRYRGPMSKNIETRIRIEAEKCVLLCPNCHWEITLKEIDKKYAQKT